MWCGHMEAEGTRCAHGRTLIVQGSLTCMCEGAERASQGQQEQQLDVHLASDAFLFQSQPLGESLRGKERDTGALAHTPGAHTPHRPASPEGKG